DCDGLVDETFRDDEGRYHSTEHCGGCGVDCALAFPTAEEVACVLAEDAMRCAISRCPLGTELVDESHCAPTLPVACLPCASDDDCHARDPRARCGDGGHCLPPCLEGACPEGFACAPDESCAPIGDPCTCTEDVGSLELACVLEGP